MATIDPRIERTRSVVLDVAAALIGEVGFGRTSIEAIAERSGVARSTIYRHWPDRTDLLVEAIDCKIAQLPTPETGDLREDLLIILGELAERLSSSDGAPIMMSLLSEARRDPQMATLQERFTTARFGRIKTILETATDRGDLPKDVNVEQMVEDLVAPLFFRAFIRRTSISEEFINDHIDRWIDACHN